MNVTVFDSKADAFLFKTACGSQVTPALHITKPLLHDANFRSTFPLEGFYAYAPGCDEPFTGTYAASEETGVVIAVSFANPVMHEFAVKSQLRPVIYWHGDDDNDGLEFEELPVKFMTAAAGGR